MSQKPSKEQSKIQKYIVTSALTYANGDTHLGHIAGSILPGDIYARYRRLKSDDIIYVCGSDEYGTAIEMAAIKENITPQEVIDKYHTANKKAYEDFGISFDVYSRTSLDVHKQTAQDFFLNLYDKNILYTKTEKQLYSIKLDTFLADRFVEGTCPICGYEGARGDQCENCGNSLDPLQLINPVSKISGDVPIVKETTNFYFPLTKFQSDLQKWLDSKKDWKPNVVNYAKGLFKTGLVDRSVTRDLKWGIPVPVEGFENKVIYVWIEAPVGYISATKDLFIQRNEPDKWKDYWQNKDTKLIHFLGKDNVIFHAIIFPSMLMAHGDFVLPDNIPANEYLNISGAKFSKSKGIGVLVKDVVKEFNPDIIRYAITSNMPENKDSEFSWDDVYNKNNSELSDILGNYINRVSVFAKSKFDNKIPARIEKQDDEILNEIKKQAELISSHYEKYRFKDALTETMNMARLANKYFNDSEPWKIIREDKDKCGHIINNCLQISYSLAIAISTVLPFTSDRIIKILNTDKKNFSWDKIGEINLTSGNSLGENEILFPKLEKPVQEETKEVIIEEKNNLIDINDFKKTELKIAKIIEAEKVPKSKKLLKLKVKAGDKIKQIVSGISEHYTPEELIGKSIVIVDNLKPSKLMGIDSEGMLLAAKKDGKLRIVTVDNEIDDGAEVS
jgi:methionyl-tRNA synthetase